MLKKNKPLKYHQSWRRPPRWAGQQPRKNLRIQMKNDLFMKMKWQIEWMVRRVQRRAATGHRFVVVRHVLPRTGPLGIEDQTRSTKRMKSLLPKNCTVFYYFELYLMCVLLAVATWLFWRLKDRVRNALLIKQKKRAAIVLNMATRRKNHAVPRVAAWFFRARFLFYLNRLRLSCHTRNWYENEKKIPSCLVET